MKRITTTEEFDNSGKLTKRTVVEEQAEHLPYAPYIRPVTPPSEWPQWTNVPLRVDCGSGYPPPVRQSITTASYQDQASDLSDRPDYNAGRR